MPTFEPPFTRELVPGVAPGIDIEGIGRALARANVGYMSLSAFNALPAATRRSYGSGKQKAVNRIRKREGWTQNRKYTKAVHGWLIDQQAFDAKATNLMLLWEPPISICYPIARSYASWICQGPHETGGIPGNWAYDFCVPEIDGNGAPILAVQDGWVYRLSGKPPSQDTPDPSGTYGWSVYIQTRAWLIYYYTHLGERANLIQGQKVRAGDLLGKVGDQRFRPDHVHLGCTHPLGPKAAREQMERISRAPRVAVLV